MRAENIQAHNDRFACFDCRKAFRVRPAAQWEDLGVRHGERPRVAKCPGCGRPMADMGPAFQAPRRLDVRRWRTIEREHPVAPVAS